MHLSFLRLLMRLQYVDFVFASAYKCQAQGNPFATNPSANPFTPQQPAPFSVGAQPGFTTNNPFATAVQPPAFGATSVVTSQPGFGTATPFGAPAPAAPFSFTGSQPGMGTNNPFATQPSTFGSPAPNMFGSNAITITQPVQPVTFGQPAATNNPFGTPAAGMGTNNPFATNPFGPR